MQFAQNLNALTFGQRLKAIRKSKKITQNELAKIAHIGVATIIRYEKGAASPSFETLKKIATALEVPQYELMDDEFKQPVHRISEAGFDCESNKLISLQIKFPPEGGYEITVNGEKIERVSNLSLNISPTDVVLRVTHDTIYKCNGDFKEAEINFIGKETKQCQK